MNWNKANWRAFAEELRTDDELEKQTLEMTKAMSSVWRVVVGKLADYSVGHVQNLERLIDSWAKEEWGPKTQTRFERDKKRIVVFDDRRIESIEEPA